VKDAPLNPVPTYELPVKLGEISWVLDRGPERTLIPTPDE